MWAAVQNGSVEQVFREPKSFTLNEIQYPITVFTIWSNEDRIAIGLYPIETDPFPDLKSYSVQGTTFEVNETDKVVLEHWNQIPLSSEEIANNLTIDINVALVGIDQQAENERLKYITGGSGQALTYQEKYTQALDVVKQDTNIIKTDFPLIANEIGITADDTGNTDTDMKAVANIIIQNYELWKTIGGAIEQYRLQTKKDIRACATSADVATILTNISWPHP